MLNFIYLVFFFVMFSFVVNADQKDKRLDALFSLLINSNDNEEIIQTTENIWQIWLETNDPLIENEFKTALQLMDEGKLYKSIKIFTNVIEKNPDFAEAWNKRATVYFLIGDFNSSIFDIKKTLILEPRHFGAMDGLALIFISLRQYEQAVDIYEKMLKIFPNNFSIINKQKKLLKLLSKST